MDNPRKLIVGYDLCDDYSQISCYSYKTFEPIPISPVIDDDNTLIPTTLSVIKDSRNWVYGQEAIDCARDGSGILIDRLLSKLKNHEEVEIFEQTYSAVSLLEKFFRKTLTLTKNHFPTERITQIVVTLHEMDGTLVEGVYETLSMLGIDKDRATVISHGSSFMHYALSQDKGLWLNDVGLFDFNEEGLEFYRISVNRRVSPMIAGMEKKDFTDTLNYSLLNSRNVDLGFTLDNIANTVLYKQIISTLYFTGRGFDGGWAEDVVRSLCAGRRVFMGQNLFTMGACYAAKELAGDKSLSNIILLNNDMIISSIAIRVYMDGMNKELFITDAAVPWYEVSSNIDVILDEASDMELVFRNIMTKETIRERIPLQDLPDRPSRMTRLKINIVCINKLQVKLTITDMGFGDIYPSTVKVAEFILDL